MATLAIQGDELIVRLSPLEKLAAFHGNVHVPLSAIEAVSADSDPWSALRGVRAPGTGIPGLIAYGVRRMTGERPDFAALWGGGAAVRVELRPDAPFGRLLVTVADPTGAAVAAQSGLRSGM